MASMVGKIIDTRPQLLAERSSVTINTLILQIRFKNDLKLLMATMFLYLSSTEILSTTKNYVCLFEPSYLAFQTDLWRLPSCAAVIFNLQT